MMRIVNKDGCDPDDIFYMNPEILRIHRKRNEWRRLSYAQSQYWHFIKYFLGDCDYDLLNKEYQIEILKSKQSENS